ncbi:unnamed protein product, partial [Porites evermanni]
MFQTYVEKIRPRFSPNTNYLFCTTDGKSFREGHISRPLPRTWVHASGVRPDLRVTATDIRQWLVTTVHEKKAQGASFDKSDLQRTMCHSDKTAKQYYLRGELTEVADRALDIIIECTPDPKPMLCDASTKRSLTRTEKAIISKVFADLIASTDRVEIQEIRHGMRKTVQLRILLEITGMDVKVAD